MVAIAAQWIPSANAHTLLNVQITGCPRYLDAHFGWGISVGSPATYGGLTSSNFAQPIYQESNLFIQTAAGLANVVCTLDMGQLGALGDHAWVCLFHAAPGGGTVPDAVAGPFVVQF